MKNVSSLIVAAAVVSAGHLFAAEETLRVELQPTSPQAGASVRVGNPGAPLAQNPYGGTGKSAAAGYIEYIEKSVTLTPEQKATITKILEGRDKASKEFQAKNGEKLQAASKAMTDAYQSKDKEAMAKAQKESQELSAESTRIYTQAQADLEAVFTPEQKAKRQEAAIAQTIKSMTDPAVLTEEQTGRIKAILAKRTPGREREEHEWYQSIQDVLTPEQKATVAKHRALAMAKSSFYRANLTDEQSKKVEAAYDELAKAPGSTPEAITKQLAERINGLLTAEQKEKMKQPLGGGLAWGGAAPGQAINRPNGSPQIIKIGEGGEGISITINGDGKVSTKAGPGGGNTIVFSEGGRSEKGTWLGITTGPVSETLRAQLSLAKEEGLVVGQVMPGSPANAAGLQTNDILLRLDDQILVELSQLRKLIAMKQAGDHVKLVYLRKAARQESTATLAEHEIEATERSSSPWLQAIPGLSGQTPAAGHELAEKLPQLLQQLLGSAMGASTEKNSASLAPLLGALLSSSAAKPEPAQGNLENLRKRLESSSIPEETKEKIRKSIDQAKEAADKARAALDEATKAAGNPPRNGGGGFRAEAPLNPASRQP